MDEVGPLRKRALSPRRCLALRQAVALSDGGQPAADREDRVRLDPGSRIIIDSFGEAGEILSQLVDVLGGRDRRKQGVQRRSHQGGAVLARRIPVEHPLPSSSNDVQGLTWADHRDRRIRSPVGQAILRDVDDLDAVMPVRICASEVLMHLSQADGHLLVWRMLEYRDQIDVTDPRIEVATRQGAEEVQTDQ